MKRRGFLAGLCALSIPLAGCSASELGDLVGESDTSTPSGLSDHVESGRGPYPHPIMIENGMDSSITRTVTVRRDGTKQFEERFNVSADTERTVAGITTEDLPRAHHEVVVSATGPSVNPKETSYVVDPCYGGMTFVVNRDRSYVTTSVC